MPKIRKSDSWKVFCGLRKKKEWPEYLPVRPSSRDKATLHLNKFYALHQAASRFQYAKFKGFSNATSTGQGYSAFMGYTLAWSSYNALYSVPWSFCEKMEDHEDGKRALGALPELFKKLQQHHSEEEFRVMISSLILPLNGFRGHFRKNEKLKISVTATAGSPVRDQLNKVINKKTSFGIKEPSSQKDPYNLAKIFCGAAYSLRNSSVHGQATPHWFNGTKTNLKIIENFKVALLDVTWAVFSGLVLVDKPK